MIRKRLILVLHSFCLALLLIGSVGIMHLERYILGEHAVQSVKQVGTAFFMTLREYLITNNGNFAELATTILSFDNSVLYVQLTDGKGKKYTAERRSEIRYDLADKDSIIDLTNYDINEFRKLISSHVSPSRNGVVTVYRAFWDEQGELGSFKMVFSPGAVLIGRLNSIAIGAFVTFLFIYVVCFIILITVNRSLRSYYSLLEQIKGIDYDSIGLSRPSFDGNEENDATKISTTFQLLMDEMKRSDDERERYKEKFETSKITFLSFINHMTDGAIIRDKYRNVIAINDRFKDILGIKEEVIGDKIDRYLPERVHALDFSTDVEIIAHRGCVNQCIEYKGRHFDIKKFHAEIEQGKINIITIVRDITAVVRANREKAHFQHRIFITSKLASLGVLASGVAHEMYNPLTVISGNVNLLQKQSDLSDCVIKKLERISKASDKMKGFVDRLRSLENTNRRKHFNKIQINTVINDVVNLLSSAFVAADIKIVMNLRENLPDFLGDGALIENALINLLINSKEAFDNSLIDKSFEKGIEIKTVLSPAGNLCVEVTDNAGGIPEDVQKQIFDPIFGSKEVKKTGLGLSLVREIIHQHDGDLFFFTTAGEGTTFKFFIPCYRINNDMNDEIRARPRSMERGLDEITILFVHNNSEFSEKLRDFLMGHYNVIPCMNVNEIDEGIAKSCDLAFTEMLDYGQEEIGHVETLRKLSSDLPFVVVVGNGAEHEFQRNDLEERGVSEVLTRDQCKLNDLHQIIARHIDRISFE